MTTSLGPTPIANLRRPRTAPPPTLEINASSRPPWLTQAPIASPPLLLESLERLHPNTPTPSMIAPRRLPVVEPATQVEPLPRFAHSA